MSKWAPDNAEGLHAYVVTTYQWGRSSDSIEYSESLKEAKAQYGWTRMLYTTKRVRRATPTDLDHKAQTTSTNPSPAETDQP